MGQNTKKEQLTKKREKYCKSQETFFKTCILLLIASLQWKNITSKTIRSLTQITAALQKKKNDTNIAEVSGASASIAGTALTVAGLITMPFTREFCKLNLMTFFISQKLKKKKDKNISLQMRHQLVSRLRQEFVLLHCQLKGILETIAQKLGNIQFWCDRALIWWH